MYHSFCWHRARRREFDSEERRHGRLHQRKQIPSSFPLLGHPFICASSSICGMEPQTFPVIKVIQTKWTILKSGSVHTKYNILWGQLWSKKLHALVSNSFKSLPFLSFIRQRNRLCLEAIIQLTIHIKWHSKHLYPNHTAYIKELSTEMHRIHSWMRLALLPHLVPNFLHLQKITHSITTMLWILNKNMSENTDKQLLELQQQHNKTSTWHIPHSERSLLAFPPSL